MGRGPATISAASRYATPVAALSQVFIHAPLRYTYCIPCQNSLVYCISIAYIGRQVWRSHREEAKRGPPSGQRIPRNEGVRMSLLLPYATTGVSLLAEWCVIGATPRGQTRTPAMILPLGCEGLRVRWRAVLGTLRRPCLGRPR